MHRFMHTPLNRQALQEGRQALRNSEKCIDKQHDDVIFTIYAPTGKDPNIVKINTKAVFIYNSHLKFPL